MKYLALLSFILAAQSVSAAEPISNPLVDYPGFLENAEEVAGLRQDRVVTEAQFLAMAASPGTIILDARSANFFEMLHVRGAINLPFTDFIADALAKIIPAKDTPILIYCNNNFLNQPVAFASKVATTSLNVHTFNSLYSYGYRNVYELGPLIDASQTRLELVGTLSGK